MLYIAGTIPIDGFELSCGTPALNGDDLVLNGRCIPCGMGAAACVSAALKTCGHLNIDPPKVILVGDCGNSGGSRELYSYLLEKADFKDAAVLTMHYIMPIASMMKKVMKRLGKYKNMKIVADAGSMYAIKAAGLCGRADIMIPDMCELSFLADSGADHPAYIAKHLINGYEIDVAEAVRSIYAADGAPELLIIKGETDYVVENGEIKATVNDYNNPEMEAIGGTGDTITGMVSAFCYAGVDRLTAAILSLKANRKAGEDLKTSDRVSSLVNNLTRVFKENLCNWSGACYSEKA